MAEENSETFSVDPKKVGKKDNPIADVATKVIAAPAEITEHMVQGCSYVLDHVRKLVHIRKDGKVLQTNASYSKFVEDHGATAQPPVQK
jgi:hypothetical protein